jgi:DNA-binding Lrp family transcriptional regulator
MRKLLTALDVKILHALCEFGPRNLSRIARVVGIPRHTLEFRVRRMQSNPQIFLRMYASVYHTKLGLKKAFVIAKAQPGKEQLLFDCLKVNGYWLYVCRSYGTGEGCTAIYALPVDHCQEFEEFVNELRRLEVAENTQICWSTCFQGGRITSEWFDNHAEEWVFQWNAWMKEVQAQKTDLPYTLMEPESWDVCADETDVQTLMWLELDATKSINEIARNIGISRQLAQFHYKDHLIRRNLIEGYEIFVMRYGNTPFTMAYFIVSFPDYTMFAKFANSLLNKFFIISMGKILGRNALLFEVFLPTDEFRKFVDTLSKMAGMRLVRNYRYVIQDLRIRSRQTFSGEFFKDNVWMYDHKKHMDTLQQKIKSGTSQL